MMWIIISVAGLLLGVFALCVLLIWIFQERVAFQPPPPPFPDPSATVRVDYVAPDGQRLFGYLVGDPAASQGLLLSFHGNADLAIGQVDWAKEIVSRTSISVMLAEYRGYMGVDGKPGYEASQLDSEAAYHFARDVLHVPAERIALFGHSMGSAVATELAVRHPPVALLIQAPFTSARDMARIIGWRPIHLLWGAISRLHFDTEANVASLNAPVWVSHGAEDRLIPARMGKQVFAAAKIKGELLIVPGASHNDVGLQGGESYWRWITGALAPIARRADSQGEYARQPGLSQPDDKAEPGQ